MEIREIPNTCSMSELGDITLGDLSLPKKEFFKNIKDNYYSLSGHVPLEDVNQLIYNSTYPGKGTKKLIENKGFKKIHSYKGNSNRMVHTYVLNCKTLAFKKFIEKLDN